MAHDNLEPAVGWAIWTLQNTSMSKATIFKKARARFGVPAMAIEREVVARLGQSWMDARSADLMAQFRPQHLYDRSLSMRVHYAARKHLKDI